MVQRNRGQKDWIWVGQVSAKQEGGREGGAANRCRIRVPTWPAAFRVSNEVLRRQVCTFHINICNTVQARSTRPEGA